MGRVVIRHCKLSKRHVGLMSVEESRGLRKAGSRAVGSPDQGSKGRVLAPGVPRRVSPRSAPARLLALEGDLHSCSLTSAIRACGSAPATVSGAQTPQHLGGPPEQLIHAPPRTVPASPAFARRLSRCQRLA